MDDNKMVWLAIFESRHCTAGGFGTTRRAATFCLATAFMTPPEEQDLVLDGAEPMGGASEPSEQYLVLDGAEPMDAPMSGAPEPLGAEPRPALPMPLPMPLPRTGAQATFEIFNLMSGPRAFLP